MIERERNRSSASTACGDVLELADPAEWMAVLVAHEGQIGERPDDGSIRLHEPLLALMRAELAREDLRSRFEIGCAVVGMREFLIAQPDELFARAPEEFAEGVVDAHVLARAVEERHPDRRAVERGSKNGAPRALPLPRGESAERRALLAIVMAEWSTA